MKIIDYRIIDGRSTELLEERVGFHLNAGWQPHGGPFCPFAEYGTNRIYQAMVKYEQVNITLSGKAKDSGNGQNW